MIEKFIFNETFTGCYDKKKNKTIHSLTIGQCTDGKYHYSASYHHDGNFANASFDSEDLLSLEEAKEKLLTIYNDANYIFQPHSID